MALVVEDGTGKADAQSYISVADADTYFSIRKIDAWKAIPSTTREALLIRATFAIDSWLRGRWVGTKGSSTQALAWPRAGAIDEEGFDIAATTVPLQVQHATAEVALVENTQSFIQETVSSSNAVVSETVGPISTSYRTDAPTITHYPKIEALLSGLAATGTVQVGFNIALTAEEIAALNNGTLDVFDYPEYFNLIKWGG